ncbi:hypothetical protein C7T35_10285 [Variovorax sp. WS11]|nr:hypothetical protein C7T35_10285 [Variovorax sp. WS11]
MDALSKMLLTVRLQGASFIESDSGKQCYLPPVTRAAKATPDPASRRVMAFHLVTEGKCVTWLPGIEPIELSPGDLTLFPIPDTTGLLVSRDGQSPSVGEHMSQLESPSVFTVESARLVFGYVESDEFFASSLLQEMPKLLHIRSGSAVTTWLQALMRACVVELGSNRPGSSIIAGRMAELMVMEAIRHHVIVLEATRQSTAQ